MIIGTGVDVVDIARFEKLIAKNSRLLERLFVEHERQKTPRSLAARFAAKEAAAKALRAPVGLVWKHCWVNNTDDGAPYLVVDQTVKKRALELGINRIHLTMTHDGPVAIAHVIAEHLSAEEIVLLQTIDNEALGLMSKGETA